MKKVLSISVAAYNLEKLIRKNLDSFVNSSVRDKIEVIVTDDESKDRTAEIVQEYVDKYPGTVKLIKQKNAGPGSTVNSGIKHATGKYFKMVDGDDWVITENLPQIINSLEQNDADMIITNYQVYDGSIDKVIETVKYNIPSDKVFVFNDYSKKLYLAMHSTMFKTSILQKNKIELDNCFYTDTEYLLLPIKYIKTFMYINLELYVYLVGQSGQSVSITSMQKNIKMHDKVLTRLIRFYEENKNDLPYNNNIFLKNRIAIMASNQLNTYLTYNDYKNMKKTIKEFNENLRLKSKDIYDTYKKNKKARIIICSNYYFTKIISKIYLNKIKKMRY